MAVAVAVLIAATVLLDDAMCLVLQGGKDKKINK
jgi:hypothetical protein